jgi:protein phosphatase PTC2/3
VHHNFDDSDSGYDVEDRQGGGGKSFGIGGYKGRIIFLGDGTEVLTDEDDTQMFDNAEEEKDLASQVAKTGDASKEEADEKKAGLTEEPKTEEKPAAAKAEGEPEKKDS